MGSEMTEMQKGIRTLSDRLGEFQQGFFVLFFFNRLMGKRVGAPTRITTAKPQTLRTGTPPTHNFDRARERFVTILPPAVVPGSVV